MTSKHFIVTVDDSSQQAIMEALNAQGLNCTKAQPSTAAFDGYAVTQLVIASTWDHETGYDRCEKPDGNGCGHRAWQDLSEEQRTTFAAKFAAFLYRSKAQDLLPSLLLRDVANMEGIRLSVCQEDQDGGKDRVSPLFDPATTNCHSESHDHDQTTPPVYKCRNCNQTFCNSCTDMGTWNGIKCPNCNASLTSQAALATWNTNGNVLRLIAPDGTILGKIEEVPRFYPPLFQWQLPGSESRIGQEFDKQVAEQELLKALVENPPGDGDHPPER